MPGIDPHSSRNRYGAYGPYARHAVRADDEIRQEVCDRLVQDTWVDARDVEVEVVNGVVTLRGQVDTILAKRAAGDDAWDTVGVNDVDNLLHLGGSGGRGIGIGD